MYTLLAMAGGALMFRNHRVLVSAFVLMAFLSLVFFRLHRPRILIIQSESFDTERSKDFKAGWIRGAILNPILINESWFSLESDQQPNSNLAIMGALRAFEREKPDLVVLVDDDANERVGKRLVTHEDLKILYAGLDESPERYGYVGKRNITGFGEKLRLEPFHDLLKILATRESLRYGVLGLDNERGRARMAQIHKCDMSNNTLAFTQLVPDFKSLQTLIRSHSEIDVLLVLNLDTMPEQSGERLMVQEKEVVLWIENNAKALPIGVDERYVANGGGLAIELSSKELGELVSLRARKWVGPKQEKMPQVEYPEEFSVSIRTSRITARQAMLPPIYVEAARAAKKLYSEPN